jgi:hypothetical protein
MAYIQPDAATFKTRYPEFTAVSDALVGLLLSESIDDIGDTWLERDRARAQMLLAAHKLTLEGEPERTTSGVGAAGLGAIKRDRVGDVETEYAVSTNAAAEGSAAWYASSFYGQRYYILLRKNFPAVAAV